MPICGVFFSPGFSFKNPFQLVGIFEYCDAVMFMPITLWFPWFLWTRNARLPINDATDARRW